MLRLFVTLNTANGKNDLMYNWGNLEIVLTLDKSLKILDSYRFCLYNDQLMLLGDAQTGDPTVERGSRSLQVKFEDGHIWIPGHYFLLVRIGDAKILRFDLTLNEHCTFQVDEPKYFSKLSTEDILSGRLCRKRFEWKALSQEPGIRQWKEWLIRRAQLNELNVCRNNNGIRGLSFNSNLLLESPRPTANTLSVSFLKDVAELEGELKGAYCADFVDDTKINSYERLHNFFKDSTAALNPFSLGENETSKVYCFYQVGRLTSNEGKTLSAKIRTYWPSSRSSAIFCGTRQEIKSLLDENPSWQDYFPQENRLEELPYTCEEFIHCFFNMIHCSNIPFSPEATDKMCRLIVDAYRQGVICQWKKKEIREYLKTQLIPAYCQHAMRQLREGQDESLLFEVRPEDIDESQLITQTSTYMDTLEELNAMVGLDAIKQSIATLSHRMHFYATRRQLGLPTSDGTAFHAIFTGNPGTGKTTVARLLGRTFHSLGLLSRGEVICLDRAKMIGRYVGETEDIMKHILQEARGNVLLVDEAYTLYSNNDNCDYGRHAVECLLDVLSQKEPDMLIIFAGYKREMDKLMSMNPGLVGRFPYKFHFADYDAAQLMQIAENILSKDQYQLTADARAQLEESISDTVANRTENFSNARWVEQFVRNGIIPAMADRVSAASQPLDKTAYQRIEAADVVAAYENYNPRVIELKPRHKVGFTA